MPFGAVGDFTLRQNATSGTELIKAISITVWMVFVGRLSATS